MKPKNLLANDNLPPKKPQVKPPRPLRILGLFPRHLRSVSIPPNLLSPNPPPQITANPKSPCKRIEILPPSPQSPHHPIQKTDNLSKPRGLMKPKTDENPLPLPSQGGTLKNQHARKQNTPRKEASNSSPPYSQKTVPALLIPDNAITPPIKTTP